ncbi:MAG: hypothetical protein R6X22_07795 [Gemmatimonadota bacterium]
MGSIPTRSRQLDRDRGGARRRRLFALLSLVAALAAPPAVRSQEPEPRDSAGAVAPAGDDSAAVAPGAPPGMAPGPTVEATPVGSRQEAPPDTLPRPPVGPMGALLRSFVLPGWGQAAVDQPLRGAFYFAMEAGSLFMLLTSQSKLSAAERAIPADSALVASRKEQVEDWAVLAGFWALFSGIDAWVSAQLWDFQAEVVPPPDGSPGVAFRYSVPVGP